MILDACVAGESEKRDVRCIVNTIKQLSGGRR